MKLSKRIKQIVALTVEDFHSYGNNTNETTQSLKSWLYDDISKVEGIEDLNTYQISIIVLDKLKSLDIVDLEYIHNVVLKEHMQVSEISISLSEVVL